MLMLHSPGTKSPSQQLTSAPNLAYYPNPSKFDDSVQQAKKVKSSTETEYMVFVHNILFVIL
ncbi:hypothetical protein ACHAXM_001842 [Skeletonema potamos]